MKLHAFRPRLSQLRSCVTTTTESFGASSSTTNGETEILNKLKENFPKAESIVVEDISGGCGAMYQVQVVSEDFRGKTLVEQHKQVGEVLKEQVKNMHGIRIFTQTPTKAS